MIEKILKYKNSKNTSELEKEIIESKNARYMFLYLYFVNQNNIEKISDEILKTQNFRYIHFLLRKFEIKSHKKFLDFILTNNDPKYLFNILYDIDYLNNEERINLINRIIFSKNNSYIVKSLYYYFVVLNMFDEDLFKIMVKMFKDIASSDMNFSNYKEILEKTVFNYSDIEEKEEFSPNCYKGRKDYIPTIIVCHINNTYKSALYHFYNEKDEVSSHFVIRRDGYIKQVVSLDDSSWANGTSLNENSDVYYKFATTELINKIDDNANYFTFSIEHESFDGSLTSEQLKSTVKVMKKIIQYVKEKYNYDFQIDRKHIIGHSEVNPIVRTKCPGNKFPFKKIIDELKK